MYLAYSNVDLIVSNIPLHLICIAIRPEGNLGVVGRSWSWSWPTVRSVTDWAKVKCLCCWGVNRNEIEQGQSETETLSQMTH